jgi:hypothetical protein
VLSPKLILLNAGLANELKRLELLIEFSGFSLATDFVVLSQFEWAEIPFANFLVVGK